MQHLATPSQRSSVASFGLNDNQWQSRCLATMVAMSPSLHADEAGRIVAAACAVGSFRQQPPEDAAMWLMSRPVAQAA